MPRSSEMPMIYLLKISYLTTHKQHTDRKQLYV